MGRGAASDSERAARLKEHDTFNKIPPESTDPGKEETHDLHLF